MLRYLFTLSLLLMLAACGGASDGETNTTDTDTDTVEPTVQVEAQTSDDEPEASDNATDGDSYSISITGAETFDFESELDSEPVFGCVENEVSVQTFSMSPKIDIYMKSDIEPGTYALQSFDANTGAGSVEGAVVVSISGNELDGGRPDFYFTNPEGEFVITSMPSEIGDMFVGSFNGTLENNDGDTITVVGDFNLETTGTYFMDCAF